MAYLICKTATTPADPKQFVSSLKKWFPDGTLYSVYEAGFSGFELHRELELGGISNIVINPASLEIAPKDKVKTDKRDSKKLAEQLAVGRLTGISIPTREEELRRLLTRTREQVMKERVRTGNRIKSRLFYFGYIPYSEDTVMNKKLLKKYESLDFPTELRYCLNMLIAQWHYFDKAQSFVDSYCEAVYPERSLNFP